MELAIKILTIVIIICAGIGVTYSVVVNEIGSANSIILYAVVSLTFLNIGKLKRVKMGSFEAEMQRVIDDANVTVNELKKIVKTFVSIGVNQLSMDGRLGGMSHERKYELLDEFQRMIGDLELDTKHLEDEIAFFHRIHTWDHVHDIAKYIIKGNHFASTKANELMGLIDRSTEAYPSRDEIIKEAGDIQIGDDLEELFKDYEFYKANKKPRRFKERKL